MIPPKDQSFKAWRLKVKSDRYDAVDLLTKPEAINTMWELEVARGKAK